MVASKIALKKHFWNKQRGATFPFSQYLKYPGPRGSKEDRHAPGSRLLIDVDTVQSAVYNNKIGEVELLASI